MQQFTLFVALLLLRSVGCLADSSSIGSQLDPPTTVEVASAIEELKSQTATTGGTSAPLSRAMLLLKRMELHGGGWNIELASLTFDSATASRSVSTVDTIGMPGESAEFRLADQPDGTVFVCFNASRSQTTDALPLRSGGSRSQIRLVPYSSAVTGKPLQQLELTVSPLTCWDTERRYACCAMRPATIAGELIECGVFRIQVAFC